MKSPVTRSPSRERLAARKGGYSDCASIHLALLPSSSCGLRSAPVIYVEERERERERESERTTTASIYIYFVLYCTCALSCIRLFHYSAGEDARPFFPSALADEEKEEKPRGEVCKNSREVRGWEAERRVLASGV